MLWNRIYAFLDRLRAVQLWLAALAAVVMIGVTLLDVFLRYFFNKPVRGSYDLVESMLIVLVFNGMSTAFLRRRTIVIDLIDSFAAPAVVGFLTRVAGVLTVFTLALYAYAMLTPAIQYYNYGDRKLELQLPIYILWAAALIGISGAILCAIGALFAPREPKNDGTV
jgi:TRAP-type C4-dicarboxylate transport system permease small subunit